MQKFIKRLIEIRTELNLSQLKLSTKINVSASCINRWESGQRIPSAENIISLCKALNCSADYLLGLKDDE